MLLMSDDTCYFAIEQRVYGDHDGGYRSRLTARADI